MRTVVLQINDDANNANRANDLQLSEHRAMIQIIYNSLCSMSQLMCVYFCIFMSLVCIYNACMSTVYRLRTGQWHRSFIHYYSDFVGSYNLRSFENYRILLKVRKTNNLLWVYFFTLCRTFFSCTNICLAFFFYSNVKYLANIHTCKKNKKEIEVDEKYANDDKRFFFWLNRYLNSLRLHFIHRQINK